MTIFKLFKSRKKSEKPRDIKLIVFRVGQDQPADPYRYCEKIVKRRFGRKKIYIEAWRIGGTLRPLNRYGANVLYTSSKETGALPDFGTPSEVWEGKGSDGRSIVALFFFK